MFSQKSLMEAIKLLPWCISVVVPFCYTSGALSTATQQDEGISIMSKPHMTASEPEPESHGLPVPGPPRGLTPTPGTSFLLVPSLPDIPLSGAPLIGHPFSNLLAIPSQGKWDHTPSGSLDPHPTKRTHNHPPKLRLGMSTAPHGVMTIHPT